MADQQKKIIAGLMATIELRDNFITNLEEKLHKSPWITIKSEDDLPDSTEELFLVYRENGDYEICFHVEGDTWDSPDVGFFDDVTHYMPTPELPKGKE